MTEKKFLFVLSNAQIAVIGGALSDAPYRVAKPVIDDLNAQLQAALAAEGGPDSAKPAPASEAPAASDPAATAPSA